MYLDEMTWIKMIKYKLKSQHRQPDLTERKVKHGQGKTIIQIQHKTIEQIKQTQYRTTGCLSKIEKTDVFNPVRKQRKWSPLPSPPTNYFTPIDSCHSHLLTQTVVRWPFSPGITLTTLKPIVH